MLNVECFFRSGVKTAPSGERPEDSFANIRTPKILFAVHAAMDAVSTAGVSCSVIFTRIFFNASSWI